MFQTFRYSASDVLTKNCDNIIYTELNAAAVLDPDMTPNIYSSSELYTDIADDIQNNGHTELEQALIAPDPDIGIPVQRDGVLSVLQSEHVQNGTGGDDGSYQEKERQNSDSDIQDFLEDPDFIPENRNSDSVADENTQGRPKQGRKRKYPNQNRQIRKKNANTNQEHFNAKGKKVAVKEFLNFNCNCRRKCTEKISEEIRRAEFEVLASWVI